MDHGARWGLRRHETAEHRSDRVGDAVRKQLLVRVDLVFVSVAHQLGHRDRHREPDHGYDHPVHDQVLSPHHRGNPGCWDPSRDLPNDLQVEQLIQAGQVWDRRGYDHQDQFRRNRNWQFLPELLVHSFLHSDQEHGADQTRDQRTRIRPSDVWGYPINEDQKLEHPGHSVHWKAELERKLVEHDVKGASSGEAADEGQGHVGSEDAKTEDPHQQLDQTGDHGDGDSDARSVEIFQLLFVWHVPVAGDVVITAIEHYVYNDQLPHGWAGGWNNWCSGVFRRGHGQKIQF